MPFHCTQLVNRVRPSLAMAGLGLFLSLCSFPLPLQAGEIVLSQAGSEEWQISAAGLSDIQSLDLNLGYDAQRLPGVTVTTGTVLSGALSALNDTVPGTIRLGVVSSQPLPASGLLLAIKAAKPGGELLVSRFEVKTTDGGGRPVTTAVRQQLASSVAATSPTSDVTAGTVLSESSAAATIPSVTVSPRTLSGSVTFNEPGPSGETRGITSRTQPPAAQEPETARAATLPPAVAGPSVHSGPEKRFHSQEGIVAAIEHLPRPWSVEEIKEIFLKSPTGTSVRQEPPVVLADGKNKVSLYLPKTLSKRMPTIGVQGCTLGNIWDAKEQGWEVELFTQKDSWPATALLLGEGDLVSFPIVVLPRLPVTIPAGEDGSLPLRDFDGDGIVTATDAYLYVGNLLAR